MKYGIWLPCLAILGLFLSAPKARAGYSHYFTWQRKPDQAKLRTCLARMRQVMNAARKNLAGPEGEGDPIWEPLQLQFNGKGEEAHEPFCFPGVQGPNFCKTQGKAYDEVVTACLLVARDHFPKHVLEISSDGSWSEGAWTAGQALYQQVFRKSAGNPMGSTGAGGGAGGDLPPFLIFCAVVGVVVFLGWQWNKVGKF